MGPWVGNPKNVFIFGVIYLVYLWGLSQNLSHLKMFNIFIPTWLTNKFWVEFGSAPTWAGPIETVYRIYVDWLFKRDSLNLGRRLFNPHRVARVRVVQVEKYSPADRAGLQMGDCILQVNGLDLRKYSLTEVQVQQLFKNAALTTTLTILPREMYVYPTAFILPPFPKHFHTKANRFIQK